MDDYTYWDLGDLDVIRMSDKALANVLRSLIQCNGRLHDACQVNGHYKNPNMNTVSFRISLPSGKAQEFMDISGLGLSSPPRVADSLYSEDFNLSPEEIQIELDLGLEENSKVEINRNKSLNSPELNFSVATDDDQPGIKVIM